MRMDYEISFGPAKEPVQESNNKNSEKAQLDMLSESMGNVEITKELMKASAKLTASLIDAEEIELAPRTVANIMGRVYALMKLYIHSHYVPEDFLESQADALLKGMYNDEREKSVMRKYGRKE